MLRDLPKPDYSRWRPAVQAAYAYPIYRDAKRALLRVIRDLCVVNDAAARRRGAWRRASTKR